MDNYIVSARKYRPSTFKSVVGQHALTRTLKNAIDTHKLAHAYLFCGPRGVGKTSCARIFAKTINCLHPTPDGEACNECESCRSFNEQRSYNILELDAASNNGVDEIRALVDQVRIPPQVGKYKVFIVDEVHMLSTSAFNAFLKTLEEPPAHAIFILATTEKHKILPTILSRCQVYDFHRITVQDIVDHLAYVASQEGITAEEKALSVIAQKADGGMRDALSIFDQVASFTAGNITYEAVIENLNVLDYEYYFGLTDSFLAGNVPQALLSFKNITDRGFDSQFFVVGLANHFRDLLVSKDPVTLPLLEVGDAIAQRYGEQAQRCPQQFLYKAMDLCNKTDINYKVSTNKRFLVELMLVQLCQLLSPEAAQAPAAPAMQPVARPAGSPQTAPAPTRTAAPQPAAAPASQQAQQPAQPAAQHPAPAPRPVAAGRAATPAGRPPTPTIRINAAPKAEQQAAAQQLRENPFTQEGLTRAWDSFAETMKGEVALHNTMLTHRPTLQDGTRCQVTVDSPYLQARFAEQKDTLTAYLRNALSNDKVEVDIILQESNEKKVTYDAADIIKAMVVDNPNLRQVITDLNMDIE